MGITGYDGDDFAISTGTSTNDRLRMDPSGNTIIGSANNFTPIAMHDTVATVSARGPIASGYSMGAASAGPRNTRDWFVYSGSGTMGSNLYVHMKTNSTKMYRCVNIHEYTYVYMVISISYLFPRCVACRRLLL